MFELLLPGGELLVVFLASNPLFSVYEKLSDDSTWSKYMTVRKNKLFKPTIFYSSYIIIHNSLFHYFLKTKNSAQIVKRPWRA